jgi:hypothetical protein
VDQIDVDPSDALCLPYGTTRAMFHTHPQDYPEASVPSGFASVTEYYDSNHTQAT